LLNVPASAVPSADELHRAVLSLASRAAAGLLPAAQQWWLEAMRSTQYPLLERMTLLWHNHFATAVRDEGFPDLSMVLEQNALLRKHALGNFATLVKALTVDPAMLFWLNGAENATPEPNENYGRELLELFTLGKHPQPYTETDVREAARALTGWTCDPTTHLVAFDANRHDMGDKTVLGEVIPNLGNVEYQALIDIALKQPAAAQFVAFKMVMGLAYVPTPNDDAVDPLVANVADELKKAWDIRAALRVLLLDPLFRDADVAQGRQLVRQPIDTVVATCKALKMSADDANVSYGAVRMGQGPFRPPNVGGWPAGSAWLSPATALARYDWGNTAYAVWAGHPLRTPLPAPDDLSAWANLLGLAGFTPSTTTAVQAYLTARAMDPVDERKLGVLLLLLASPDWTVL
jgi:uncharacterized protein (DUF1800 family)